MIIEDILEENTLYSFYGVDCNEFKIGDIVFEAIEDCSDDFRSYLDSVVVSSSDSIFSKLPIINLYYMSSGDYIEFFDRSGHVWLSIGTDHTDDYYPMFVFYYNPRKDVRKYSTPIANLERYDPKSLHAEKLI